MSHQSDLISQDILAYLSQHERKELLRFLTCGNVDDGKSTLIGRLLHDSKMIYEDHMEAITRDSKKSGTTGEEVDLALLVDGLQAEREQGITIDVAYRYFSTAKRKFIIADTPGHEQYTRNMATGASTCDLAIIPIDARHGVQTQTKRHSFIASLLGIKHIVVAVNKMDLMDFDQTVYDKIREDYLQFASGLELLDGDKVQFVPMSALKGDNVVNRSERSPWYTGPSLMEILETVEIASDRNTTDLRFPVQLVTRPNLNFRGFAGTIASGVVRKGDELTVLPSGKGSRVKSIVTFDGELEEAGPGQAVTLTLEDEIDISRGDMICAAGDPAEVANQFETTILWMADEPMYPGRPYLLKTGTSTVNATITRPKYRIDVNTLSHDAAHELALNEVGVCNISLDRAIPFDPYQDNRETGGFILIDKMTNSTVGMGMIHFALRRSSNVHWQALDVERSTRASIKGQKPVVLWFTGLSGSGKSTIANIVDRKLIALNAHTMLLDGDNVRHGLNKDLGFTDADRVENIRRVAEVAKLMTDAGLITLVSFISPFRAERRLARDLVGDGEFIEVFVDTPLEVAEARDRKGLYKKARAGQIKNFTGIDSPYEAPENAEIRIETTEISAEAAARICGVER